MVGEERHRQFCHRIRGRQRDQHVSAAHSFAVVMDVLPGNAQITQGANVPSGHSADTGANQGRSQRTSDEHWSHTRYGQRGQPDQQATQAAQGRAHPGSMGYSARAAGRCYIRRDAVITACVVVSHHANSVTCKPMVHEILHCTIGRRVAIK